ncbi:hypothetical protein OXPF_19920 [Oxobacter pfennigii]|uniref:Uncharacterized protein n=1 Tax=Oxobacter pfennigii TaxID=36849 RepID=A0A0P8W9V5_9CLOT|nr:hypothetical protein [Oxobacter pfennigii]KPU44498.1 hypothetical protein OXPF_19920 [Oxobacter pfennigii]
MEENNYTIVELFEMLKSDESWESDPEMRKSIADELYSYIHGR